MIKKYNSFNTLNHTSSDFQGGSINHVAPIGDSRVIHLAPAIGLEPELDIVLRRYVSANRGAEMYNIQNQVVNAAQDVPGIIVPSVLKHGVVRYDDLNDVSKEYSYWIETRVSGVNAKLSQEILNESDYLKLVRWGKSMSMVVDSGIKHQDLATQYGEWTTKLWNYVGTRENILKRTTKLDGDLFSDTLAYINELAPKVAHGTGVQFVHGDFHIANIMKNQDGTLGIIDFEAANDYIHDPIIDIDKLVHLSSRIWKLNMSQEAQYIDEKFANTVFEYWCEIHDTTQSSEDLKERLRLSRCRILLSRFAFDLYSSDTEEPAHKAVERINSSLSKIMV